MGKVDDMRAMREARFAATQRPVKGNHVPLDTESCGHRSISGGYCTRPKGHTEKNHRYKTLDK